MNYNAQNIYSMNYMTQTCTKLRELNDQIYTTLSALNHPNIYKAKQFQSSK